MLWLKTDWNECPILVPREQEVENQSAMLNELVWGRYSGASAYELRDGWRTRSTFVWELHNSANKCEARSVIKKTKTSRGGWVNQV